MFCHDDQELRAVVHGDDFTVLGWEVSLNWFWGKIQERYQFKHRGRLGPQEKDAKEMRILNRIVTWTREGIEYEGDQRHVEIAPAHTGVTASSRGVATPATREFDGNATTESEKESGPTSYR